MIVRCIANTGAALPKAYFQNVLAFPKTKYQLTVGKEYTVYAREDYQGCLMYYVVDDGEMYYPMRVPAPLFEVTDPTPPSSWRAQTEPTGLFCLAPPEWFADPLFYDRLVDGEPAEVAQFAEIRHRLDAEARSAQARAGRERR